MPTPLRNNNEIKIFTLFLMDRIGCALDYETIGAIVVRDGIVRYIEFSECFRQLLSAGLVREVVKDGEESPKDEAKKEYEVTESGREVARILGENLMVSVREQGVTSAMRHLSLKRLGAQVEQSYTEDDGTYAYHCSIRDPKGEALAIDLRFESRRDLDTAMRNFAERPEDIYRGVVALLVADANYLLN